MMLLVIGELEVQVVGNQAFLYGDGIQDVLNIDGIENNPHAEDVIKAEIEIHGKESLYKSGSIF